MNHTRHSREGGNPVTDNLDLWSSTYINKSTAGRGTNGKQEAYGIKKLRELILELAVRGKLVQQDPNDEPASVLLEKIAKEKARLIKDGKIKEQYLLPEISDEEKSFDLPVGWVWARFIDALDFKGGSQPPKSTFSETKLDGYVQLIQIRDLGPNPQPVFVPVDSVSKFCTEEDIMIGRYGASVGKVFWGEDGAYNVALIKLSDDNNVFKKAFLFNLMRSPLGQSYFLGISRSAQDGFSKNDIAPRVIPIPPLNEQHRIVAKVDELMALCDKLEQQQTNGLKAHQTLVETLLGTLTSVESQEELTGDWNRIANHFDTLFTTEQCIDQLKQTILQLAVMGKLVPQDPNDEPANVLLEKIAEENVRLKKEKKIKNHPPVEPFGEEYNLPSSWESIVVQNFADVRLGSTPSRTEYQYWGGNIPWVSSGEVANCFIDDTSEKITREGFANSSVSLIPKRSVLIAIIGQGKTRGQSAILNIDACTNQNVAALVFNENFVVPEFVLLWAKSKYESHRSGGQGGAQPALNGKKVRGFRFYLPPTTEQHRIVKRVDELMALCDTLKARLKDAQTTQIHLADAIVEKAVA